jgi:hypothetical protein
MATKKKSWNKLGSIRRGEDKETKQPYNYIKLEDNVEIYVDGEKVSLNKYRTVKMDKPEDTVNRLRDLGVLDDKKADERLEKLSEIPWLLYELTIPPGQE